MNSNFSHRFFPILFGLLLVTLLPVVFGELNKCPDPKTIEPCVCVAKNGTDRGSIICEGQNVTQTIINEVFTNISLLNGQPRPFLLTELVIADTYLTELDLNPLAELQLDVQFLEILSNLQLKQVTPNRDDTRSRMMKVGEVDFVINGLVKNEAVGNLLTFINPTTVEALVLDNNHIEAVPTGSNREIIPGISNLTRVERLVLGFNPITRLEKGAFGSGPGLTSLKTLNMVLTRVQRIGKEAFDLPGHEGNLTIALNSNALTNENFEEGFISPGNNKTLYTLDLGGNNFDHLSADLFEPLIHPQGPVEKILARSNRFVCDWRMKWLRDGKDIYNDKVLNVDCTNDKNHTIFDTIRDLTHPDDRTTTEEDIPSTTDSANTLILSVHFLLFIFVTQLL